MQRRKMLRGRDKPEIRYYCEPEVIETGDDKATVRFTAQIILPKGFGLEHLEDSGLIWSSKETTELIVDNELNPELKPTYTSNIGNVGGMNLFACSLIGMPKGRFVRGILFMHYKDIGGNVKFTYSEEKRAVYE